VVSLRVEALDDEEAKGDLRRGLGRLTHLVVQMLDLERLSLSSETRSDIDLGKTAGDVLSDLAPMAIKAGYDLLLVAPDHPVIVSADAQAATRAITNLVGNSIVHGGAAGEIAVVVGADGTLDVTDEGPGVSPALQTRLFEPFSRESSNADGSGLGLHLTREIMRAHGGDVRLVPTERGASFRLRFAAPAGEATAKPLQ
jgi:signal transduction histidine kinase